MMNRRHFVLAGGAALAGCAVIPQVNNPLHFNGLNVEYSP